MESSVEEAGIKTEEVVENPKKVKFNLVFASLQENKDR
jgi:hypothetical protein